MKLNINKLKLYSILYLAIPFFLFLFGWFKFYVAVPIIITLCIGLYSIYKSLNKGANDCFYMSKKVLISIGIIILIWCILGGIGYLYYQSSDHHFRNAIFRDLITYDWPVIYEDGNLLIYYIGLWLFPAFIGKIVLFTTGSISISWFIANIILLLWCALGLMLTFLMIIDYLKVKSKSRIFLSFAIFIFFSGCDVIGLILRNGEFSMHLEMWNVYFQYSSNTTQVFWVFNQAIPAWIVTMLVMNNKDMKYDLFIATLVVLFAPLPLFGLFVLCVFKFIGIFIRKKKDMKLIVLDVVSLPNLISLPALLIGLFYTFSNTRAIGTTGVATGFNLNIGEINIYNIIMLFIFMIVEFGIYLMFVFKDNKRNPYFYACLFSLPIICMYRYGATNDFEMRASIPLLFVLMVMVMKVSTDGILFQNKKVVISVKSLLLCIVLLIGSITAFMEFYRGYYNVRKEHKMNLVADDIQTLEGMENAFNFKSESYNEGSLLYRLMK